MDPGEEETKDPGSLGPFLRAVSAQERVVKRQLPCSRLQSVVKWRRTSALVSESRQKKSTTLASTDR